MNNKLIAQYFGRRLKVIREIEKDETQEQFAEVTDLGPNHIGQIERGGKLPRLDTLIKIRQKHNISIDKMIDEIIQDIEKHEKELDNE